MDTFLVEKTDMTEGNISWFSSLEMFGDVVTVYTIIVVSLTLIGVFIIASSTYFIYRCICVRHLEITSKRYEDDPADAYA